MLPICSQLRTLVRNTMHFCRHMHNKNTDKSRTERIASCPAFWTASKRQRCTSADPEVRRKTHRLGARIKKKRSFVLARAFEWGSFVLGRAFEERYFSWDGHPFLLFEPRWYFRNWKIVVSGPFSQAGKRHACTIEYIYGGRPWQQKTEHRQRVDTGFG